MGICGYLQVSVSCRWSADDLSCYRYLTCWGRSPVGMDLNRSGSLFLKLNTCGFRSRSIHRLTCDVPYLPSMLDVPRFQATSSLCLTSHQWLLLPPIVELLSTGSKHGNCWCIWIWLSMGHKTNRMCPMGLWEALSVGQATRNALAHLHWSIAPSKFFKSGILET